ncbi:MAG: hypothetical protein HRU03_00715 [Nanoarchaeales archaeon]|nr:hypothetical protein [Nanoarchaeales archaeon]
MEKNLSLINLEDGLYPVLVSSKSSQKEIGVRVADSLANLGVKEITLTGNISSEYIGVIRTNCVDRVEIRYFTSNTLDNTSLINGKVTQSNKRILGLEVNLDKYMIFVN